MNKKQKQFLAELEGSIREGGSILRGENEAPRTFEYPDVDVKEIRSKLHKTQKQFAEMIGIKVATLRNWEQGRRHPTGPALALLKVADARPNVLVEVLEVPAEV